MSKTAKIKPYLTSEEILLKIKGTVGFWRVQKWLIIYNALNYPRSAREIVYFTLKVYRYFNVKVYHFNIKSKLVLSFLEVPPKRIKRALLFW